MNKIKTKQMEDFVKTRANFYEIEKNFASIQVIVQEKMQWI